jgi:MOSC domain-containing protein YiiM
MDNAREPAPPGTVASLHLHPATPGEPLAAVDSIETEPGAGIVGEPRYYRRRGRDGRPSRRQLSLIEREQIDRHAETLGLGQIDAGRVRANIETSGIALVPLVGRRVRVGRALLHIYEPRTPCRQMDEICQGLRSLMENDRQGVMAEIIEGGPIRVGDPIIVEPDGSGAL